MKRFLLSVVMLYLATIVLKAQTITWTGAGDGTNWSDADNWDLLVVPSNSYDVMIPYGSKLTIDVHAYMKSILVQNHTTLNIYNNITFKDQSLFDHMTTINWFEGGINSGETGPEAHISSLTNKGAIYIHSTSTSLSYCKLNNEGDLTILNSGALFLATQSELYNLQSGRIIMNDESDIMPTIPIPGYYTIGLINNYGEIEGSIGTGIADIMVPVNNFGVIHSIIGQIRFSANLDNNINGKLKGTSEIDLPSSSGFINNGIIEPGASVGTLTLIGDFISSSTSKFEIDINSLTQSDLLAIEGSASFNGVVDITMGFDGNVNDEFIVATTTGTISSCNLAPIASAEYEGITYDFSVTCRNNKEVVLTITNKTLGVDSFELSEENIVLFPNPSSNQFTIKNNSNQVIESGSVMDINGGIVQHFDLINIDGERTISINEFASGMYLIKLDSENTSVVKKLIKI